MTPDLPGLVQQIAHFENRLAADPGSRAFLPLADLYRRADKLEDARRILQRGIDRHPGFVAARALLGLVLFELGDGVAARAALAGVLEVDPDNILALRLLGREASEREAWAESCACYERLLRLEPENREVREGLRAAQRELARSASSVLAADAKGEPAHGPMTPCSLAAAADAPGFETPTLAELYLRQGHPAKARVILERILAAEPEHADALRVLARLNEGAAAAPAAPTPAPESAVDEAATPPPPSRAGAGKGHRGRADDLDRFRAWLDAASDQRGSAP